MKITVVTQYFPPEMAATGRRAQDLAASLAGAGHRVTVIAGRPNHPASLGRFFSRRAARRETTPEGYVVLRVPVFRSSDARPRKRLLNYLTFLLAAAWKGIVLPRPDVVVAISPLPAGLAALAIHGWHRAPLIYDLQDIWPDSARAVGVMAESPALRLLRRCERLLYRCCARVVAISCGFRRYLEGLGVPPGRIAVIENGVEFDRFAGARPEARLRRAGALRGRFVVGYIGNLGLAQGLDTLLESARHLRREPVSFLLIGEGVERQRLERRAREEGLGGVRFMRGVPRRRVPGMLAACDALVVMLREDPLFEITIPSKLYEYMAAGKPVLCAVGGEAAALVARAGCGLGVRPSDGAALATGVRDLMASPAASRDMGEAGARWVSQHASRAALMRAYAEVLCDAAEHRARPVIEPEPVSSEAALL